MKSLVFAALLGGAALAHAQGASAPSSPAKKELVQKVLVLQQAGIENIARGLVEQPLVRLTQAAAQALQGVAPEKRESVGKQIDTDIKKYIDEATPIVRDRAIKLAPSTLGAALDEKFSEDELKQIVAWLESPVNKKYNQLGAEMQSSFTQKLVADARPVVEPKLQALDAKVRVSLGLPPAAGAPAAAGSAPARATPPKKAASK